MLYKFVMCFVVGLTLEMSCFGSATNAYDCVCKGVSMLFDENGGEVKLAEVRSFGFGSIAMNREFVSLCNLVSNQIKQVTAEWGSISTNEVVRMTVLNAACYSGVEVYTNFVATVANNVAVDSTKQQWSSLKFLVCPYGTPQELFITYNYTNGMVRGWVNQARVIAEQQGDDEMVQWCLDVISGKQKTWYEEMKLGGAL